MKVYAVVEQTYNNFLDAGVSIDAQFFVSKDDAWEKIDKWVDTYSNFPDSKCQAILVSSDFEKKWVIKIGGEVAYELMYFQREM